MKPLNMDDKKTGKILLEFGILFMILNLLCAVEIWQSILHNWTIAGDSRLFTQAFISASGNYQITYLNQQSVYLSFLSVIFSFLGNKEELVLIINLVLQILGLLFFYFANRKMVGNVISLTITAVMALVSGYFYPVFSESSMHMAVFLSSLVYWICMKIVTVKVESKRILLYVIIGLCAGMIFYVDFTGVLPLLLVTIYMLLSEKYHGKKELLVWFLVAVAAGFGKVFSLWNSVDSEGWNRWLADRQSFFQSVEFWRQYLAITGIYSLVAVSYIIYQIYCLKKEETQEVYAEVSVQEEKISLEEPQMKIEQEQKIESVIKTEPQIENKEETSAEPEKTKVKLLDNPLPLPKKHVKKEMNYAFEPSADQMHYDLNNYRVDDDYDLKTNI